MSMRANLRQQLQRQQMLEMEKREHQETMTKPSQTQSQNITMPVVVQSPPELPPKILQVKTPLEHPTRYHIRQNQKRQVQMFLSESLDHNMPAHSMPALTVASPADAQWQISGSAPTDLDSPALGTSSHSGMEEMDLLSDLISLESVEPAADNDLHFIEPSLTQMSSTVSTPPNMSEEEARMWAKDRQKKDNHNMILKQRGINVGLTDEFGDHGDLMVSPNVINLQTTIKTEEQLSPSATLAAMVWYKIEGGTDETKKDFKVKL
nr:hypothetical protein BaRGS_026150 [Batillaria attramentaria]